MSDTSRPAPLQQYEFSVQVFLLSLMDGTVHEVVDGLPQDAELRDAGYDRTNQVFYLTVEHPDFDPVHEAEPIPREQITFRTVDHEITDLITKWEDYGEAPDVAAARELKEVFERYG